MSYALTDTQRDMVDVILDGENPDNAFIATQVGCSTRQVRNMADFLSDEFDIIVSESTVSRILKREKTSRKRLSFHPPLLR
jgi:hypothetical protein